MIMEFATAIGTLFFVAGPVEAPGSFATLFGSIVYEGGVGGSGGVGGCGIGGLILSTSRACLDLMLGRSKGPAEQTLTPHTQTHPATATREKTFMTPSNEIF